MEKKKDIRHPSHNAAPQAITAPIYTIYTICWIAIFAAAIWWHDEISSRHSGRFLPKPGRHRDGESAIVLCTYGGGLMLLDVA